ncbi:FecR domain-containing protein [endosymbiont of Lamellibrachia barhami]|uniref:FecR domain-containing protein n=1 Tax=endosymbiont of Lamellibrachia barhami TaxID=205975 RepID=UPI0015B2CCFC|nr:FecR domain-containing protein [endosymbiont of Lamellibrachia barhami]
MLRYTRFITAISLLILALPSVQAEDWVYRMRSGDSLSKISAQFLKNEISTVRLQYYNQIENPTRIPLGSEIKVPLEWLKLTPSPAEVLSLEGEVSIVRAGESDPVSLSDVDQLQIGDVVTTGRQSSLALRFADGSRLMLGPETQVSMDTLSAFGEAGMVDTRVRVQYGRVESEVEPLQGAGARFQITTPAAVTMVRGTGFRVGVEFGSGLTRNEVVRGQVAVEGEGESLDVDAGFGTMIEPGKPPLKPRPLLTSPDISMLEVDMDLPAASLRWSGLEGAEAYRVQLFRGEPGGGVIVEQVLTTPEFTLLELTPGSYSIRVRGIDELGLEGLSAEHRFLLNEPPPPPPPVKVEVPVIEAPQFNGPWMWVRWNAVDNAWGYRFLVAADPMLQQPLLERVGTNPERVLPVPWPGTYYIRVDALMESEDDARQSQVYRLDLPLPQPGP